jgi:predicted RNA-binding Zn-ribbon protein involved in translation (DUF1610 family)
LWSVSIHKIGRTQLTTGRQYTSRLKELDILINERRIFMAKSTRNRNTRTARRRKPAVYSCTTCGKVTKTRSHLCSPVKAEQTYICRYCGTSTGDPRHVCAPMVTEMKYACRNCGRVTPFRGAVCQPKPIR